MTTGRSVNVANTGRKGELASAKFFVAMFDVKEDLVGYLWAFGLDWLCAKESGDRKNENGQREAAKHGGRK
jgi:hypothetical protein